VLGRSNRGKRGRREKVNAWSRHYEFKGGRKNLFFTKGHQFRRRIEESSLKKKTQIHLVNCLLEEREWRTWVESPLSGILDRADRLRSGLWLAKQ